MAETKSSYWFQFFKNASIPENICLQYSKLFAEHRIQKSQLIDFNKSLLNEIGITAIGDVLAILKCAQKEAEKCSYEKLGILEKQIEKAKKSILKKEIVKSPEKVVAALHKCEKEHVLEKVPSVPDSPKKPKIDTSSTQTSVFQRGLKSIEPVSQKKNIFDRLGRSYSPNPLAKVTFSPDTKSETHIPADEVTSTTDDTLQSLESDRILQKQTKSPLTGRIGLKMTISNIQTVKSFSRDSSACAEIEIIEKMREISEDCRLPRKS
uniref:SAM domain-containing protein n=1 Tax=Romanomermis culicivorax TaxID=13658 RepID=A0A915J949_ROMCU